MTVSVSDNPTESRFEVHDGDTLAGYADYTLSGDQISLIHTVVDDAFEGRGLAKELAETALTRARERGLAVLPPCEFISTYIRRNPEWLDLVPEDRRDEFGL